MRLQRNNLHLKNIRKVTQLCMKVMKVTSYYQLQESSNLHPIEAKTWIKHQITAKQNANKKILGVVMLITMVKPSTVNNRS
jgi:hypothetical protein